VCALDLLDQVKRGFLFWPTFFASSLFSPSQKHNFLKMALGATLALLCLQGAAHVQFGPAKEKMAAFVQQVRAQRMSCVFFKPCCWTIAILNSLQ